MSNNKADRLAEQTVEQIRALQRVTAHEYDGEESDGTPRSWRRPFVPLGKVESIVRAALAKQQAPEATEQRQALAELARWNFDATETCVTVCRNHHEKGDDCEYEPLHPAEVLSIINTLRAAVLTSTAQATAEPAAVPVGVLSDAQITEACSDIYLTDFPEGVDYEIAIGRAVLAANGTQKAEATQAAPPGDDDYYSEEADDIAQAEQRAALQELADMHQEWGVYGGLAMTPGCLADYCEAWLQAGGASNLVDAYEAGARQAEKHHAILAEAGIKEKTNG